MSCVRRTQLLPNHPTKRTTKLLMTNSSRIRSRHPSSWPPQIMEQLTAATKGEVLVPFETNDRVKEFRAAFNSIRRSCREHTDAGLTAIDELQLNIVQTTTMIEARQNYNPDPVRYPITVILSPTLGFGTNLEKAVPTGVTPYRRPTPEELTGAAIELELLEIHRRDSIDLAQESEDFVNAIFRRDDEGQ